MEYKLDFINMPQRDEYLSLKSVQMNNDILTYWVTKKADDESYEKINSDMGKGLAILLSMNDGNKDLQQNYANMIGELAQNKIFSANLISQLAQQQKTNLEQKQINAQLIAQLAKNGGNNNV
ncbi:hypothetical protein [Apilactobacillus timberlakei]|uniref:Uncharacterized protein n=1 Tax=Apilactobacillus timberlakei TaxID=2008380 RepID=A0ABY2YR51_9LACO|nr:hypothetical protein [Apilactobacillus timberlakei]TPR12407.1 hypothetical protein DY048_07605 [Apilactobacillus timberlakei]TPR12993.1 hypothetical protein DY052_08765 [Apilactobacillus timberlakei]